MSRGIIQEPFRSLTRREWKRAKRILPILRQRKMPTFEWSSRGMIRLQTNRSGCDAYCYRNRNLIVVDRDFMKLKDHGEFVRTLRHEIAHLPKPAERKAHGASFKWWLERLGGGRWARLRIELEKVSHG